MGGMLLAGLSGFGQSVAQSAGDYQKLQDQQQLDAARSDLQVQAAQRIAENNNALQNREQAQTGSVYQQAHDNYLAGAAKTNSDGTPVDPADLEHNAVMAGANAQLSAGKTQDANGALALTNAANNYAATQNSIAQSGMHVLAPGAKLLDSDNNVVGDNTAIFTQRTLSRQAKGQTPAQAQAQIENAQIKAKALIDESAGTLQQPYQLPTDDPTKPTDSSRLNLTKTLAASAISDSIKNGTTADIPTIVQGQIVPKLDAYDKTVRSTANAITVGTYDAKGNVITPGLFPPSSGMFSATDNTVPGNTADPAIKARFMQQGAPASAFASPTAFQRWFRDSAMNVNDFNSVMNRKAPGGTPPPSAISAPQNAAPAVNPKAPPVQAPPVAAPAAVPPVTTPAPIHQGDLLHDTGTEQQYGKVDISKDPVIVSLKASMAGLNGMDPANAKQMMALGTALNDRIAAFKKEYNNATIVGY